MAKFVRNIVLFLLPLLLIVLATIPLYFLAKGTGETDPIEKSAEEQRNNHNSIIGLGYNEQTAYYKLLNANYYEAPIISLGTSRVMQFKEGFFSSQFYNCGGAVAGNYNEYRNFIENLAYTPEMILVGLDAWVFNDAWNAGCAEYNTLQEIKEVDRGMIPLMKAIVKDWISKKWSAEELNMYPGNIGFNGRVKDNGFMYDGSYYYGDLYRDPTSSADYKFIDTKNRISNGVSRFEWGRDIDEDTLIQLESLLSYCKEHDITVIGFLAPFAPSIYSIMEDSGNYNYLNEIAPACNKIFSKYGYEFYDYMDGAILEVTDEYFVDGFHGSEIVYGRIIEKMIENDSDIKQYADLDNIKYLIENAYSEYVFDDPFTRSSLPE